MNAVIDTRTISYAIIDFCSQHPAAAIVIAATAVALAIAGVVSHLKGTEKVGSDEK